MVRILALVLLPTFWPNVSCLGRVPSKIQAEFLLGGGARRAPAGPKGLCPIRDLDLYFAGPVAYGAIFVARLLRTFVARLLHVCRGVVGVCAVCLPRRPALPFVCKRKRDLL